MKTKADFRRHVRQEKQKHTPEELIARSEQIWARLETCPEFRAAGAVAVYWSLPDEVFTHRFVEKWCGEKTLLLPVMLEGCDLELRKYSPGCTLSQAGFYIQEPDGEIHSPAEVDLILVPGMAFDTHNQRVGRGKGYYDRLLCRMNAFKIGVCFDFQFFNRVPADDHDVTMDRVLHG